MANGGSGAGKDGPLDAGGSQGDRLDREELAKRSGVPEFVVDLVIDAGLLTPRHQEGGAEFFGHDDVAMLEAARTVVGEGVAIEEMAALAMRHATNVEQLVDDAIDIVKRHATIGSDRASLVEMVQRLVPAAAQLVAGHFERTLTERAMARIGGDTRTATATILVATKQLDEPVDPLAIYASADSNEYRSVWLHPDARIGIAAIGAIEMIEPTGSDRFSAASAARSVLAARTECHGPDQTPAPVLVGGFAFTPADQTEQLLGRPNSPNWSDFGDCRLVLPEFAVIDRAGSCWVQAAIRVGADDSKADALADLQHRLETFPLRTTSRFPASRSSQPQPQPAGELHQAVTSRDHYLSIVEQAVGAIDAGDLDKVVLARSVSIDATPEVPAILQRLRHLNPNCATFAFSTPKQTFLGSTPEELATLNGSHLHTTALAGTAPRGGSTGSDERLAQSLLASAKNRSEHHFVVEAISAALSSLGLLNPVPLRPDVMKLNGLQHLRTPITAQVQRMRSGMNDMDVLRAAGALHPTAAVGGAPSDVALSFIAQHESFDRGWYAAPVGWCDLEGNGEMAVALRSGLAEAARMHLFAGAGIVAGSVPESELAETDVKLSALLDVIQELEQAQGDTAIVSSY